MENVINKNIPKEIESLEQTDIESLHLERDPRKLLAFFPTDARKIFNEPARFNHIFDRNFLDYIRPLNMLYEAVQSSLMTQKSSSKFMYPTFQEVMKHLSIYKRSISDNVPVPTEEEMLNQVMILAGQKIPFIHVLRELVPDKGNFSFETTLVAPTIKHEDKVVVSYRAIVNAANNNIRSIMSKVLTQTEYINLLNKEIQNPDIEMRKGRMDYELRKIYLDKSLLKNVFANYKGYVTKINKNIFQRIYRNLVLEGLRTNTLLSFNCDDVRKISDLSADQYFDIIHFSEANYLHQRYKTLCNLFSPDFFGSFWDAAEETSLRNKKENDEIDEKQYYFELSQLILSKSRGCKPPLPPHLINLLFEVIKLSQWQNVHSANVERQKKQLELNDLGEKLKATGNLYNLQDKKWLQTSPQLFTQLLQGKVSNILACTEPYIAPEKINPEFDASAFDLDIFLILKDKNIIAKAIETVEKLYKKKGDIYLLRIIENILQYHTAPRSKLMEYVAPLYLKRLDYIVNDSYKRYLSWWARLYFKLFSKELSISKLRSLRRMLEKQQSIDMKRRMAKQKLYTPVRRHPKKSTLEIKQVASSSSHKRENVEQSEEERSLITQICKFLDTQWQKGKYPTRSQLFNLAEGQTDLLQHVLSFANVQAVSARSIVNISVHGMDDIYASRDYLKENRTSLIRFFSDKLKEEEIYKIDNRTYISTENSERKFIYQGILNFLKKNINL